MKKSGTFRKKFYVKNVRLSLLKNGFNVKNMEKIFFILEVSAMKCDLELNARQKKIMTYLLSCRTVREASQKAGIRLATVFKWLKDPVFKAELDRLREEVISDVVDRLKVHCMKATDVLVDLMESENETIRRGSANDILRLQLQPTCSGFCPY
jgi:hypothetical protein